jgi:phage shock protein E
MDIIRYAALALLAWMLARRFLGKVAPEKAHELIAAGARLIDVRTEGEYASGHLPGAVNIPVHELSRRVAEAGTKSGDVIVYCASGMRSASATSILKRAGFTRVYDGGGMHRLETR